MEQDVYKSAQGLDKQILIWAIVILFSVGLIMFRIIANQLTAILKQLQVTVDRLVIGFERHTILIESNTEDIKELKEKKRPR